MRGNTITIELPLKRGKVSKTIPLYQYDYGQKLIITDVELPSYYEVHFSNEMHGDAVTSIGDSTGVEIPDSLLATGENVYLWLYLHDSDSDGETEFQGAIPVIKRARVTDQTPTPHEQSVIEQAINALNGAIETAVEEATEAAIAASQEAQEAAEEAAQDAEAARDAAQAVAGNFQGMTATVSALEPGSTPTIEVTHSEGGFYTLAFAIPSGEDGTDGDDGQDGADGVTFTPSVSAEGVISWTNDGNRQNPESVNIKGPKGDQGDPAPAADVADAVDAYLEENFSNPSNPPLDRSLTSSLSAAPADIVGDIKNAIPSIFSNDAKSALLNLLTHVAWADDDGQIYYQALEAELIQPVASISAVFSQGQETVWSDDSLDSLKQYLTVTAVYSDATSEVVSTYTLSGTLDSATSTITVTYGGKTTTFNVAVRLVGSTNYALQLVSSNYLEAQARKATFSNDTVTFAGVTQSQADGYNEWIFGCRNANATWDALKGKTMRFRFTESAPNWQGAISSTSPQNRVINGMAIFKNTSISDGQGRHRWATLDSVAPGSESNTYEYVVALSSDLSCFTGGTGTPDSNSVLGISIYVCTTNTVVVENIEIVEVLN